MGVGVEYFDKGFSLSDKVFIKPGGCNNKGDIRQKTGTVIISSLDGISGTIYVVGNTQNTRFRLFNNEADEIGRPIGPHSIEEDGKIGVFLTIEQEQELLVTNGKGRTRKEIHVFICESPTAMAEKLIK